VGYLRRALLMSSGDFSMFFYTRPLSAMLPAVATVAMIAVLFRRSAGNARKRSRSRK
jgi:TctA family transporter